MKLRLISLLVIAIIIVTACSPKTDEEIFYDAQKKILNLNSYVCETEVKLQGNKQPSVFTAKQWYMAPDKYRIEILSPENLNGKTTIYNGKKAFVYHPRIGQNWMMQNSPDSLEEKTFLGSFMENFINSEEVKISRKKINKKEYLFLETEIPGNNPYFNKKVLWLDIEKYHPYMLQILDNKGQVRVDIKYYNFKFNEKFNEETFNIQGEI